MLVPLMPEDRDALAAAPEATWQELRGATVLLTGGTGFVGAWLLAALAWAARERDVQAHVVAVTRDPRATLARLPWVSGLRWVDLRAADVRELVSEGDKFTHVVVGATSADADLVAAEPATVMETAVSGGARTLAVARESGARVLVLSSGAVYGPQPFELPRVPEEYPGAPDSLADGGIYGEAKRAVETLACAASRQYGLHVSIARMFAFVGAWLPLDRHFAVGNFIRDGLSGGPIVVAGDGSPQRSYLYGADMAVWLLTILALGANRRAYNVGSERAVSVGELARLTAAAFDPPPAVEVLGAEGSGGGGQRYVACTRRAREELGLRETVGLEEALARTAAWHKEGCARR